MSTNSLKPAGAKTFTFTKRLSATNAVKHTGEFPTSIGKSKKTPKLSTLLHIRRKILSQPGHLVLSSNKKHNLKKKNTSELPELTMAMTFLEKK